MSDLKHDTEVVQAIKETQNLESTQRDIEHLQKYASDPSKGGLSVYEDTLRQQLSKAVFVGHVNTDLDSVAGAIGAAALFGGTPALAEPFESLNGEVTFALKHSGIEPPKFIGDMSPEERSDICLVDHTEEKQMTQVLKDDPKRLDRIVGVIDHHALAASFKTSRPIFMDLRPWGSMSSIVGYLFVTYRRALPKQVAVLLMQAILSDTLNLRSVTTTIADRSMVALLYSYVGVATVTKGIMEPSDDAIYQDEAIDTLAQRQFQAKTDWVVSLGPYEMVRGDQKDFTSGPWKFGVSVLEVTSVDGVMKCAEDILLELRLLKKEKGLDIWAGTNETKLDRRKELDFAFLFVVNVVDQYSLLLICGAKELALAKAAFLDKGEGFELKEAASGIKIPGDTIKSNETCLVLPTGYVSRKKQFAPAFFAALQDDFSYQSGPVSEMKEQRMTVINLETMKVLKDLEKSKLGEAAEDQDNRVSMFEADGMQDLVQRETMHDTKIFSDLEDALDELGGNLYDTFGRVTRGTFFEKVKENPVDSEGFQASISEL